MSYSNDEADKHWKDLLPDLCGGNWQMFYDTLRNQGDSPLLSAKECIQVMGKLNETN